MATLAVMAFVEGASPFAMAAMTMAASYIDSQLFRPPGINGPRLESLRVQTSTYGNAIPKVYGKAKAAGNIIWGTKFVEHVDHVGGGIFGAGASKVYNYTVSFAVMICKGPIIGVKRIWADGTLFPHYESKFLIIGAGQNKIKFSAVDSTDFLALYTLTAKTVDEAQVWEVNGMGTVAADCRYGVYFDNGHASWIIDKKTESTIIADGTVITLTISPHTEKYKMELHLGAEDQMPDTTIEDIEGVGNVPAYRGCAYAVFKDLDVEKFGRRIPTLTFEVETVASDLRDVVEDISVNVAGLTLADIDASDLDGISVPGYATTGTSSGRELIEPLQLGYVFDGIEYDGKVYFARRNVANAIAIPYDDLGAYERERIAPLIINVADELEIPRLVNVKYQSAEWDYQDQSMSSNRRITASKHELTIDTGLIMTDAQAKAMAELKLSEAWINSTSYETALGPKYADVRPGSIIQPVDEFGNTHTAVVVKSDYGKPGLNKISAVAIAGVVYMAATRSVDAGAVIEEAEGDTQVILEFLDLPKLPFDATTTYNIYFAATGDIYHGVDIYKTIDGGATYDLVASDISQSIIGYTISELATVADAGQWDNTNTVDVVVLSGTLSSCSAADVLSGKNMAMVGNEVVQFTTATLLSAGTYRLSGMLRGRLLSESEISEHTADDRFVLLTETLGIIPTTDFGTTKSYRYGPSSKESDDIAYQDTTFAYTRRAQGDICQSEQAAVSITVAGWTAFTFATPFASGSEMSLACICTTTGGVVSWRSVTATGFEALIQISGVDIAGDLTYQAQGW